MSQLLKILANMFLQDPVLPQQAERIPIWPMTGNPREWIDPTHPNYTPSIFSETPRMDVTGVGVINPTAGATEGIVPMLRRLMSSENVARGKPSGGIIDEILRGLWLHGRGTYPKTGETFGASRVRVGNLGEPYGLSMTADKGLLERSFAKKPDKISRAVEEGRIKLANRIWKNNKRIDEISQLEHELQAKGEILPAKLWGERNGLMRENEKMNFAQQDLVRYRDEYKPKFARVFPKFGGKPSEKVLRAWVAPETVKDQQIIKDAYIESLPEKVKNQSRKILKEGWDKKYPNRKANEFLKDMVEQSGKTDSFNKEISQNLQKKGYKALLYSPERYNEYEMRMLNPDDVLMLDMRKQTDPALERMYNQMPATDNIYGPLKGRQANKMANLRGQASGREGASLRDIYSTITWDDIDRVLNANQPKSFYFNLGNDVKVEVIKNPTDKDYQALSREFKKKFPNAPKGEPKTRYTYDKEGNKYIWRSDLGTHGMVEPKINSQFNTVTNQNKFMLKYGKDKGKKVIKALSK